MNDELDYSLSDESAEEEVTPEVIHPELDLQIEPDDMSASLRTVVRLAAELSYDHVIELLDENHIRYGVDKKAIQELVDNYQNASQEGRQFKVVIARGKEPTEGKDGWLDFAFEKKADVAIDQSGRADFRNIDKYQIAEADQLLARLHPPEPGTPGINIFGDEIAAPHPFDPILRAGENVTFNPENNEYRSNIHGIYIHREHEITVSPVLNINGHVGLESGNIDYDGNVVVSGNIERGSSVSTVGDLSVTGIIETGEIKTGGDLIARKGIISRKEGIIEVGGDLSANFMENSSVKVHGSVLVYRSSIQCDIVSLGDIILQSEGSTITGGSLTAFGSVAADIIGNKNETPTRIDLGIHNDYIELYKTVSKELENEEKLFIKKSEEVSKIKVYVQRMGNKLSVEKKAQFRLIFKEYQELLENRKRLAEEVKRLQSARYNQEEVRLTARQVIYPGVELHFRNYVEKIKAPLTGVVFCYKPGSEKPRMSAYKKPKN